MKLEADTRRPDFDKAQNVATDLLLAQTISTLHVNVTDLQFNRPIVIDSVQNFAQITNRPLSNFTCEQFNGACVVDYPRCSVILFDEQEDNPCRTHWGIAHESGHLYLGHQKDGDPEEIEAHFFAAQLLMPEIVLREIERRKGSISALEIADYFQVSYTSAYKRIETLNRRGCWSYADRDKKLLEKFMPYIEEKIFRLSKSFVG